MSIKEADQLVAASEAAERPVKLFENFLFHPPIIKALELVESGAIGEPISIRIKSNPGRSKTAWKVPEGAIAWRQDREKSGGGPLIFDDGHHKFALALRFMGVPKDVHAFIGRTETPSGEILDAPSIVSFRFPENRIGNLEVVYSPELEIDTRQYPQDDRIEITGSKGVLWVHGGHGRLGNPPPVELYADGVMTRFDDIETAWEQSFVLSTRHFLKALREDEAPVLTPDQGRQILRFAFDAEESARLGRRVEVQATDKT
ncbi:MAG: Gfo/Idh/MocA family protein [Geminicoccaceae bacterium]